MIARLSGLQPREARTLLLGCTVAGVLLAWVLILDPLAARLVRARALLAAELELGRHLDAVGASLAALPRADSAAAAVPTSSLLGLVDTTSREAGLREQINRVAPDGDGTVRVWLEDVPFDSLTAWILDLQRRHGVTVTRARITAGQVQGRVRAQVDLGIHGR